MWIFDWNLLEKAPRVTPTMLLEESSDKFDQSDVKGCNQQITS